MISRTRYRIAGNYRWKKFSLKIQKAFRINFRWRAIVGKINKICVSYHYLVLTASLASFIASGLTMSDSGPLGSGRDESGLKYR